MGGKQHVIVHFPGRGETFWLGWYIPHNQDDIACELLDLRRAWKELPYHVFSQHLLVY